MRRAPADIRELEADPVFRSVLVSQVVNKLLWKGKKEKARKIIYGALEIVERRAGQDPIQILKRAIDNVRPQVEVRSRRVGGSAYQGPVVGRPHPGLPPAASTQWEDIARFFRHSPGVSSPPPPG